jgi:undecaprenyl diphosphate synthase
VARYVAIITDGSGRWAQQRGLPLAAGHDAAADTLKARISDALDLGMRELSVYTFSTENWARPASEVSALMDMFTRRIAVETPELHQSGVRLRFIGRRGGLPEALLDVMARAEALTALNDVMTVFMAFNYGGHAEIIDAARNFEGSTEEEFRACLYAPDMHDPELIIRTSGEQRISNFLLWQAAYSELIFRTELWPDFGREEFEESLADYDARDRRFGGRSSDVDLHA